MDIFEYACYNLFNHFIFNTEIKLYKLSAMNNNIVRNISIRFEKRNIINSANVIVLPKVVCSYIKKFQLAFGNNNFPLENKWK